MHSKTRKASVSFMAVLAALLVLVPGFSGISHAEGMGKWLAGSLSLPSSLDVSPLLPRLDEEAGRVVEAETPAAGKSCGFNMASAHKYMGYTTLGLAVGAAVSSSSEDLHKSLGYAAAGMATMTCITGYLEYSDYFNMDDGLSKTNIHIVSGVAATAGFIVTAILGANDDGHGGIGAASTVLMAVPIVVLKW